MAILRLLLLLPLFYFSIVRSVLQNSISLLTNPNHQRLFSIASLVDLLLSLYFYYCGLSPITIDLEDETFIHFWIPNRRRNNEQINKPSIVLIHGYGGNAKWQLCRQIGPLSRSFDLYVPDLVFFGKSHSKRPDRSDVFQARCVGEALMKRLGVRRVSVFGVSYGGYVAYRMADMYREEVEKVMIVSCGIGFTEEQKVAELTKFGGDVAEILEPERPENLRLLMELAFYRHPWVPTFVLEDFIHFMGTAYRKERQEILQDLLMSKSDLDALPVLSQETLILWGDKDRVFPMFLAYQLARYLGQKSKVEIIKDAGHAANLESSDLVNHLIKSFFLGSTKL